MKVIFLDLDGVLNSNDYLCALNTLYEKNRAITGDQYGDLFDPRCVMWLEIIIAQTDAEIVISSTWRRSGLQAMKDLWNHRKLPGKVVDITPRFPNEVRGFEIKMWLEDHPEVTDYVILDDNTDMLEGQKQSFVKCEANFGITLHTTVQAVKMLNPSSRFL